MVDKLDEMETKLNEQIERNVALNKRLGDATAQTIINNVAEGLLFPKRKALLPLQKVLSLKVKKAIARNWKPLKKRISPKSPTLRKKLCRRVN